MQTADTIRRILLLSRYLILGGFIVYIPFVCIESLYQSIPTGQAFVFIGGILIYSILIAVELILTKGIPAIKVTAADGFLGLYSLLVAVNYWLNPVDRIQVLTFGALVILYLSIRTIKKEYYKYIFILILISGAIQAIYGNLQLWGYYPSNHGIFRITGSFLNPGPYSGYPAAVFPLALGFYLFDLKFEFKNLSSIGFLKAYFFKLKTISRFHNFRSKDSSLRLEQHGSSDRSGYFPMKSLFLISITSIVLVLPAARSRAAWLGVFISSAILLYVRYEIFLSGLNKYLKKSLNKFIFVFFGLTITLSCISGLYYLKKGSADGRLLVWKVGTEMIKDKPFWGHGIGGFAANYMNYQAGYFRSKPDSPEAMVADNILYPFNEFLKITIETGLIGLLIVLAVIWALLYHQPLKGSKELQGTEVKSPLGDIGVKVSRKDLVENGLPDNNPILLAARASFLSILIFSCFSYPSEVLPIKILLVVFAAIIAPHQKPLQIFVLGIDNRVGLGIRVIQYCFSLAVILLVYPASTYIRQQYEAYKSWKDASDIYRVGAYPECLEDFELAYPKLKNNGNFLIQYGKALEMAEKHDSSIVILEQAKGHLNNTILYTTLGNNYKILGDTEKAELAYLQAQDMIPSRFYPLYLLAKLYDESGQTEKAIAIATELLNKEVKVDSKAIEEIKEEMQKIIDKHADLENSDDLLGKGQEAQRLCCYHSLPGTYFPNTYFGSDKKPKFNKKIPIAWDQLRKEVW